MLDKIQELINNERVNDNSVGSITDGYHSFDELYKFRLLYNVLLFNEWGSYKQDIHDVNTGDLIGHDDAKYNVHKSWKHNDGQWCFGKEKERFIVVAMTPDGQVSNHYKAEHWDKFKIPEKEKALFPFDGHTSLDVINRLTKLI